MRKQYDTDNNKKLSAAEINAVTEMDIYGNSAGLGGKISNLKGIEYFTSLSYLSCDYNQLTTLDLSQNSALETLWCSNNQLTSMKLNSTSLKSLDCSYNQLTTLELGNNNSLELLNCMDNRLTTLNLDSASSLQQLLCYGNQLKALDLSDYTALRYLDCHDNQLVTLDLTNNINLIELDCRNNQLTSLSCETTSLQMSSIYVKTSGNVYRIPLTASRTFNLAALPDGFDVKRASGWRGGSVTKTASRYTLVVDEDSNEVTYWYACKENAAGTMMVKLVVDTTLPVPLTFDQNPEFDIEENYVGKPIDAYSVAESAEGGVLPYVYSKSAGPDWIQVSSEGIVSGTPQAVGENQDLIVRVTDGEGAYKEITIHVADTAEEAVIDGTNFPDETFRAYIAEEKDLDHDGKLSPAEIREVQAIDVPSRGITDLKGIEFFGELTELRCGDNNLTVLDVSNNGKLQALDCNSNILTALDVSKNENLQKLNCSSNELAALDLSNNRYLSELSCSGNQLAGLELKNTSVTEHFYSDKEADGEEYNYNRRFITLDEENSFNLSGFEDGFDSSRAYGWVGGMVSGDTLFVDKDAEEVLYKYDCGNNQNMTVKLVIKDYVEGELRFVKDEVFDVGINYVNEPIEPYSVAEAASGGVLPYTFSKVSGPDWLIVSAGGTIRGTPRAEGANPDLILRVTDSDGAYKEIALHVDDTKDGIAIDAIHFPDEKFRAYIAEEKDLNQNGSLSVDEIKAVKDMDVSFSDISDLKGIEFFSALEELNCSNNKLTSLDISRNQKLKTLYCVFNELTAIDVSKNKELASLSCSSNKLTALDVSKNAGLKELQCDNNMLKTLDVSKNPELERLDCGSCGLTALDVGNNLPLYFLDCSDNDLKALDVSKNAALSTLSCNNTDLMVLDVSSNKKLQGLACKSNKLTVLDVSQNPELSDLNCASNQLSALDVSQNQKLLWLNCSDNKIAALELNNNPELVQLNCSDNALTVLDLGSGRQLDVFSCSGNHLTSLDLSNLEIFDFYGDKVQGESKDNYNTYTIELSEDGTFDLQMLPGNFDVSKAYNWQGGSVADNILTVDEDAEEVIYKYYCGNGKNMTARLAVKKKAVEPDPVVVDKTALQAALNGAIDAAEKEKYTETTWTKYEEALENAKKILSDEEAVQADVDAAVEALNEAREALEEKKEPDLPTPPEPEKPDKTRLQELLKNVIPDTEKGKYTEESWAAYAEVLSKAKEVEADEKASQEEIDAAVKALNEALEALEKKPDPTEPQEPVELPYEDVAENDWFYDGVYYNYTAKIMTGKDTTHFVPYENLARAQFAVILHRLSGKPDVTYKVRFPDVPDGQFYSKAVIWAADTKVVNGYTDTGLFGPSDYINREQMAVMMYRYAKYRKYDVSEKADYSQFTDAASVSEFAGEAMQWAVGSGIITGKDYGTRLDPQGNASRAECAIIIQRFMEKYGEEI